MSNLNLTKRILNDELINEELIECLEVKNVVVLQHTILKLISRQIKNDYILLKLLEFSSMLDIEYKILGPCKLGHLATYALEKLGYNEEFKKLYDELDDIEREPIIMLKNSL